MNLVLLSPWQCGVGRVPDSGKKRVISNLRIVATVMYSLLRKHDSLLPRVCTSVERGSGVLAVLKQSVQAPKTVPVDTDEEECATTGAPHSSTHSSTHSPTHSSTSSIKSIFSRKVKKDDQSNRYSLDENVVSALVAQRPSHGTDITSTLRYLHDDMFFESVHEEMEPWLVTLAQELEEWVSTLARSLSSEVVSARQDMYRDYSLASIASSSQLRATVPLTASSLPEGVCMKQDHTTHAGTHVVPDA